MIEMQTRANTEALEKELDKLLQQGKNLEPVMAEIANLLQNTVEEAFEQKVDPITGTPWQALSPITVESKRKKGNTDPNRPLFGDGTMQQSLSSDSDSSSAEVGFNAVSAKGYPYPIVHQYGTKDNKIVARRFLPVDDDGNLARHVEDEIMDILEGHFSL